MEEFRDNRRSDPRKLVNTATGIVLTGKEANQVGESGEAHPSWPVVNELGRLDSA